MAAGMDAPVIYEHKNIRRTDDRVAKCPTFLYTYAEACIQPRSCRL